MDSSNDLLVKPSLQYENPISLAVIQSSETVNSGTATVDCISDTVNQDGDKQHPDISSTCLNDETSNKTITQQSSATTSVAVNMEEEVTAVEVTQNVETPDESCGMHESQSQIDVSITHEQYYGHSSLPPASSTIIQYSNETVITESDKNEHNVNNTLLWPSSPESNIYLCTSDIKNPQSTPMYHQMSETSFVCTDELNKSYNENEVEMWETEQNLQCSVDYNYKLTVDSVPVFFAAAYSEFQLKNDENFLRGCKWSPDGSSVMTNSNDNCLRFFKPFDPIEHEGVEKDQMPSKVKIKESGQIYDFAWHPRMNLSQPEFCRVASTCSGIPIHMWDSESGKIIANYRAFDQYDEVTAAYSVSFSCDGSKIYAGYNKSIRIFDTEYPVRSCKHVKTINPKTKEGQRGIISCFTHSPDGNGLYVAGSYSRHIGIYDSTCDKLVCLIQGQQGGVTHLMFSPDGTKLYSGGRKDAEILCWDMRNMGHILFSALRDVKTNQRIYFDLSQSGRYLVSGNNDGTVAFWDTLGDCEEINGDMFLKPCSQFLAHSDCVNGVSYNHYHNMIATASGQRHFQSFEETDSEDESDLQDCTQKTTKTYDFSLKLWRIPLIGDTGSFLSNR
ncbi:Telomerase Cajal body protein 1 [Bulinus truncatus]|nr:Telomerase Cajal body protein 1 [Bulinus truncatus]